MDCVKDMPTSWWSQGTLTVHLRVFTLNQYVIDTVRVFLPKCPLTTVRSQFSADEQKMYPYTSPWTNSISTCKL